MGGVVTSPGARAPLVPMDCLEELDWCGPGVAPWLRRAFAATFLLYATAFPLWFPPDGGRLTGARGFVANTRLLRCPTLILVAVLCAGTVSGAGTVTFAEVMRRAHEYVTIYEDHKLSTVIARERYYQQVLDRNGIIKAERTLLSDYLQVQLPNEDWVALRDVYEVDAATVADRGARLKTLFAGPREQFGERVLKLAAESADFNLGDLYYRTLNLPTFALRILRPASRKRMAFEKAGEEQVDGTSAWIVAFRETKGPTFSGTPDGADVPAHGRFWVDPHTGAVLRSEMIIGGTRRVSARATITVSYAPEPSLGFRVPVEMQERYDNPRRKRDDVVVALATYSDFRPFDWRTKPIARKSASPF